MKATLVGNSRTLSISCDRALFSRLRQLICDEAKFVAPEDAIVSIIICDTSSRPSGTKRVLGDRIALLGCAIVAFVLLTVFVAGVGQIAGLFRH